MNLKCSSCGTKTPFDRNLDLVECSNHACKRMLVTGNEGRIRKRLEAYYSHLDYPRAAVGRAVGYSHAIYRLSTHGTKVDRDDIEAKISSRFGASSAATATEEYVLAKRSLSGVEDMGYGLGIYKVSGVHARQGPWAHVYIVFRGSRGSAIDEEKNPLGAGWGKLQPGQEATERQNLDWRTNLNTAQVSPSWSTAVKIHRGFLDVYGSVRNVIHSAVWALCRPAGLGAPVPTFITTGHSLGAGLALVCAHDLACRMPTIDRFALVFCCPRSGNQQFAQNFNDLIGTQIGFMGGEPGEARVPYHRSFVFVQSNDPISWAGEHGFKTDVSDESARTILDQGNIKQKIAYATLKKSSSKRVIYYHVRNLHRASYGGMHHIEPMVQAYLG